MTYPSLAIIGTAGRKEDQSRLTRFHYHRMVKGTITLIEHLKIDRDTLQVVSGGAAWADHVAVSLAKNGVVLPNQVTIYLPTSLSIDGFTANNERAAKTANTANYYHKLFSACTGMNSIQDLLDIGEQGANLVGGDGNFFGRNSAVAKFVSPSGALLAFTFGAAGLQQKPWAVRGFAGSVKANEAGLKDGGTADTWDKCTGYKYHCVLGPTDEDPSLL